MAIRLDPPKRRRPRFTLIVGEPFAIPEGLEHDESAEWLRQRARELYEDSVPFAGPSEG